MTRDLHNSRVSDYKPRLKRHYGKSLIAASALIAGALLAQTPAPTPPYSDQDELSKVEQWVLSQGIAESIAPELAAILGLGSDRLPVKLKAFRTSDGIDLTFAVSTNPKQKGIVISALKTMTEKTEIYSVGNAWLTDRSGTLRQTIAVDASGAKVLPNNSRAAKFKDMKDFFLKKLHGYQSQYYFITLSQNFCNSCERQKRNQVTGRTRHACHPTEL